VIYGSSDLAERNNKLPILRGNNARTYLVREKGVDVNRIDVKPSTRTGHRVELWFVPAGADAP
jgi:hypothetical protein